MTRAGLCKGAGSTKHQDSEKDFVYLEKLRPREGEGPVVKFKENVLVMGRWASHSFFKLQVGQL